VRLSAPEPRSQEIATLVRLGKALARRVTQTAEGHRAVSLGQYAHLGLLDERRPLCVAGVPAEDRAVVRPPIGRVPTDGQAPPSRALRNLTMARGFPANRSGHQVALGVSAADSRRTPSAA
jgi:hypothetical protein